MPSEHALLSPSAAERWLACPASVRLSNEVLGYSDSVYAREGTLAHTRAEIEARYLLGLCDEDKYDHMVAQWWRDSEEELTLEQQEEIEKHAQAYADLLWHKRNDMGPHTKVFLEERVYPGIPDCFGTGDAILVSPTEVEIVDFKYGAGVHVDVEDNTQLKLYGLGALEGYGDLVGGSPSTSRASTRSLRRRSGRLRTSGPGATVWCCPSPRRH